MLEKDLTPLASRIELLLMDVDGVLTDGTLLYVPVAGGSVVEAKMFDVADGAGLVLARKAGIKTGIISGRSTPALEQRAKDLEVDILYQGLGQRKLGAFEEVLEKNKIPADRICYVGDDFQDLPILKRVGFPIAVANASAEVLTRVAYVTRASGGRGAIREVVELILKAQGKWDAAMREFL
ncbi:MAG TPA: HAD hydrolase family protein [Terriglobia bacterium]|nr:HAD hydrolase family protein [Terriglobia bacterium]